MSRPFQTSNYSTHKCLTRATASGDPDGHQASSQDVKRRKKPSVKCMGAPETTMTTLNTMKMLEPRQLKPDSMETERIITVLNETIAKLEISSLIPCIITSLDRFADMLGPEITENLMEHQKLSNEMENLLSSLEEGDTVRAEEQQVCLHLLEKRLKCSVRNVLRLLLANPLLCQTLKYGALERGEPAQVFINAFGEFRTFILERLLTSPVEEVEKIQFMDDISLRIEKNTEAITALQAELAAAIQTREEEIHKKDNVIKDLKTSIQDLTEDYEADIQQIKQEGERQQETELQASQARCAMREQDIEKLGAQLKALVLEHRASELALRKRKCRLEMEIVNWMQKYDADMEEKQAEYEEVNAAYNEEKAQLSLMMEKHALLLQEYSQIEEERRICQEKKEQAMKELATKNRAATRIQALWRGYVVRSLFKSKRKKKGKGKKARGKKAKK
ncbi:dynein regulatory complex protein 10 [Cuculus canorus]|uniref:dynein regulatory complex protein 10 n=1 Tax=Cuculus canorus TaxID=55661 RepID=UPI0023AAC964|nr:dynein regulatory complex protein 10 [Cuculus canorus]XP_053938434.1 dynein regulatory complex protein 10 [Cuculus canorus]